MSFLQQLGRLRCGGICDRCDRCHPHLERMCDSRLSMETKENTNPIAYMDIYSAEPSVMCNAYIPVEQTTVGEELHAALSLE